MFLLSLHINHHDLYPFGFYTGHLRVETGGSPSFIWSMYLSAQLMVDLSRGLELPWWDAFNLNPNIPHLNSGCLQPQSWMFSTIVLISPTSILTSPTSILDAFNLNFNVFNLNSGCFQLQLWHLQPQSWHLQPQSQMSLTLIPNVLDLNSGYLWPWSRYLQP